MSARPFASVPPHRERRHSHPAYCRDVTDCAHDWQPWDHRDVDTGAEKCRRCHQVKIVCPHCGRKWEGLQMRASVEAPLLCVDCWELETKRRLDAIQQRLDDREGQVE